MKIKTKRENRYRRHKRQRARMFGSPRRPRLCVFKSAKHIYGQLIDDEKGATLAEVSDLNLKKATKAGKKEEKIEIARKVGKMIAEICNNKKIKEVIFDRAGYKFHGRIKALAEGAKEEGLKF